MTHGIFQTPRLFRRLMTALPRFVKGIRGACPRFPTDTLRRGSKVGMTHLKMHENRLTNQCSRTDSDALDVAIQLVGQTINVGHVLGVTYDYAVPEGGPGGTYHLHVSLCLIPVDD